MTIEVSVSGGVGTVVIANSTRRNALDLAMFEGLAAAWPDLAANPDVRAVLIQGEGDAFCSGADLSSHLDRRDGIDDLIDAAFLKTAFFPKPVVAAIVGPCVAGGLEIALSADVRIAATDAILGFTEVCWGIVPSGGGAIKLADQIGYAKAMDLLLSGRLISGEEAGQIGLVSQVCPADQVHAVARQRAELIAANSQMAVQAVKYSIGSRRAEFYRSIEEEERRLVNIVRQSGHPETGKAAFLKKKTPNYIAESGNTPFG